MVQVVTDSLTESNHEYWRECMKTYLIGNELWDVITEEIDESKKKDEKWKKKNALALHAIQISCGRDTFSKIKRFGLAKEAWEYLAEKRKTPRQYQKLESTYVKVEHPDYSSLYKAIVDGNVEAVEIFMGLHPNAYETKISSGGNTALHVAVIYEHRTIVNCLLGIMPEKALEITNEEDHTAFSLAAIMGLEDVVETILRKNKNLITLENKDGLLPVVVVALHGSKKMARNLYHKTPIEELCSKSFNGATLLNCLIIDGLYDLALELLKKHPEFAVLEDIYRNNALKLLAHRPSVFSSGSKIHLVFWKRWIYKSIHLPEPKHNQRASDEENVCWPHKSSDHDQWETTHERVIRSLSRFPWNLLDKFLDIKHIYQEKLDHDEARKILKCICEQLPKLNDSQLEEIHLDQAVHDAIKNGIVEFIHEMIDWYPDIIWRRNKNGRTIFADAIIYRQEKIFNLIFEQGGKKHLIVLRHDIFGNNFLHFAAKLSPFARLERISGEALQMQRELQWFKEVESIVPPKFTEEHNENNKTPKALFTEEHKDLEKDGEKWMMNTAASCMVVATLIAAVMFTSAFTVPGGNDERTGLPNFLKSNAFLVFTISNALSLFSSSTSVLMFLGILTSRYAEQDFLTSLPIKLMTGLLSLFISITTMMVAFGSAIYITLSARLSWISIPIIVLAMVPVGLFSIHQFPLCVEMLICTGGGGIFNEKKHKLAH